MDSPLHYITWHCVLYMEFKPFSDWPSRLTAFIAKELSRSREIIDVTDSYIQEAISYLISKQKVDGAWDDPNPLYDRGMKVQEAQRIKTITSQQFILYFIQWLTEILISVFSGWSWTIWGWCALDCICPHILDSCYTCVWNGDRHRTGNTWRYYIPCSSTVDRVQCP